MRTIQCRQLRSVLTSYVDDEVSGGERLIVEDHLSQCDACRRRVSRERAVRQRLQRWSAEAREGGAPLPQMAGFGRVTHRSMGGLLQIAALSTATLAIVFVAWSRLWTDTGVPLSARGQINDSKCAGGPHPSAELMKMSGGNCVQRCIQMGAHYVFVSQGVVYAIRNQDLVALARLAGQDVQLEGEVRQNLLTVSQVRPLTVRHSNNGSLSRHVGVS